MKYFLDTSVVRPLHTASAAFKRHLDEETGTDRYVSSYVGMELRRSLYLPLISFYYWLQLPNHETLGDAINSWSNRYAASDLKAVMHFVGALAGAHELSLQSVRDKDRAGDLLSGYLRRIELKFRVVFRDTGVDMTSCGRAAIRFDCPSEDASTYLSKWCDQFSDTDNCRQQCRVDDLFLRRYKSEAEAWIQEAEGLSKVDANRAFKSICEKLSKAIDKGPSGFTCRVCGGIGDAVIALESPPQMTVAHLDKAFVHLCRIVGKENKLIVSELKFVEGDSHN